MCTTVSNGLSKAATCLWNISTGACNQVTSGYASLGRRIEKISNDRLLPSIAKIVKQVYDSLPYTVLSLVAWKKVPAYIVLPAIVVYAGAHVYENWIFSEKTYTNMWHGFGDAAIYCAIQNTARFVATKTAAFGVFALFGVACSRSFHHHAERMTPPQQMPK